MKNVMYPNRVQCSFNDEDFEKLVKEAKVKCMPIATLVRMLIRKQLLNDLDTKVDLDGNITEVRL